MRRRLIPLLILADCFLTTFVMSTLTAHSESHEGKEIDRTFRQREAVFHASLTELESTGIKAVSAQSVAAGKPAELAREEMARAAAAGVTVLWPEDACSPRGYARGNPKVLTQPGIAMVGTRQPTPCGHGVAEWLAGDLTVQGVGDHQRHGARRRHCQSSRGDRGQRQNGCGILGQGLT